MAGGLLALFLSLLAFLDVHANPATFNYLSHFEGLWNVEKVITSRENSETLAYAEGTLQQGTLNVSRAAYDGVLLGKFLGPQDQRFFVKIESDAANSGIFSMTQDSVDPLELDDDAEEEGAVAQGVQLRFPFHFHTVPSGTVLSQDRYHTGSGKDTAGTYQYLIPNEREFVLLLQPDSPTEELVAYLGKKVVHKTEPTFFQKFGPTLLILAIFMGSKAFTAKLSGRQQPQPQARAAKPGAGTKSD